jgi:glycogen(starch) synthase
MKVLMLASELWPVFSGGLGVAAYELVKSFERTSGTKFTLGIPKLGWKGDLRSKVIEAPLGVGYSVYFYEGEPILNWNSFEELMKFNLSLVESCEREEFEIVHANDWMTVPAMLIFKKRGKKVVFHIHSTEYDRTNDNPRQWVIEMEKMGANCADRVIANSYRLKEELVNRYGIDPNKIDVVYNGINLEKFNGFQGVLRKLGKNVVLFVGRLTIQKGVWQLLNSAKKVIEKKPDTKFIIVGSGPDKPYLIKTAINLGIEKNIIFTGKIGDIELLAAYRMCDVFVMPSVSEPFGIVALEALASRVPVIISKSSGVSEVLGHCIKVDYWDIDLLASRILEVLEYAPLKSTLSRNGFSEVSKLTWDRSARECEHIYRRILGA